MRSDPLLLAGPIGSKSLYVVCKVRHNLSILLLP